MAVPGVAVQGQRPDRSTQAKRDHLVTARLVTAGNRRRSWNHRSGRPGEDVSCACVHDSGSVKYDRSFHYEIIWCPVLPAPRLYRRSGAVHTNRSVTGSPELDAPSCPVLLCFFLYFPVLSYLVSSCLRLQYLVFSWLVCPILSCSYLNTVGCAPRAAAIPCESCLASSRACVHRVLYPKACPVLSFPVLSLLVLP